MLESESGRFAWNLPARATGTGAAGHGVFGVGAATLNHEILNHTVEVKAVVMAHVDELDEIGDRIGRTSVKEVNGDVAGTCFHEDLHD